MAFGARRMAIGTTTFSFYTKPQLLGVLHV